MPDTPIAPVPVPVPVSVPETPEEQRKTEKEQIRDRMMAIEQEYGGFANIPAHNTHEYWGLRNRYRSLP